MRTTRVIAVSIIAGTAIGAGLVEVLHAQGKPLAYVVGEINVTDPAAVQAYNSADFKAAKKIGDKYATFYTYAVEGR